MRSPKPTDPRPQPRGAPTPGDSRAPVVQPGASQTPLLNDVEGQLEALKSATIMLVDDEPTTIEILETCLQDAGYERFVTTTDPRRAVALVAEQHPDVLLLDLNMPEVGGFDILTTIRSDEALKYTPVIILTSSVDAETKLKALELGATDFLGKPVDPSELALRLRNTLAAKAYQDRLAFYDGLTGLPNRRLLMERLGRTLRRARHEAQECAVLHIDLDRFKQINDTLGRGIGDTLLRGVAERLGKFLRPDDLVDASAQASGGMLYRVGGDEFTLVLPWAATAANAGRVARRILGALAEPFSLAGHELFVNCSIGIALSSGEEDHVETLLRHADIAMSHAKQSGGNLHQFYHESLNAESLQRLNLETHLRRALERDQLSLHFQPKVCLRTGRVYGAEALIRWNHPELGSIPPGRFIPLAEETGLMPSIGEWTLKAACRQARAWQDSLVGAIRVAVNVSSQQFRPRNLPAVVHAAVEGSGLDPKQLVLELTESMLMESPQEAARTLEQMKQMGLRLSIDDFGTGYSSLAYLKRFPIDELKIDRSFVKGVPHDADDAAIVTAIIAMAHSLGLSVVAEGVETEEQLEFLQERNCDAYQGFLFSRPLPPSEWAAMLRRKAAPG